MASATLQNGCSIEQLAHVLDDAGAFGNGWESLALHVPRGSIDPSALTFLCAWGRMQTREARRLLFHGEPAAIRRLAQLNLQEHLGLAYSKEARASKDDVFLPLQLLGTRTDALSAREAIEDLVERHFSNASAFLPALRWALQEIFDNVFTHADALEPGAVFCEYRPAKHRIEISICDLGCGILATLGETVPLFSHGHAITTALRRGVTRSEDIGQGNGLAGVVEIVTKARGNLRVWSGDAVVRIERGVDRGFVLMPRLAGTGVALSLDTRMPVDLSTTWIAGATVSDYVQTSTATAKGALQIALEAPDTGSRGGAAALRKKIRDRLAAEGGTLTLDFAGVASASSSFLDELLGRLALELGPEVFRRRVQLVGLDPLVQRIAAVVVEQRLQGHSSEGHTAEPLKLGERR